MLSKTAFAVLSKGEKKKWKVLLEGDKKPIEFGMARDKPGEMGSTKTKAFLRRHRNRRIDIFCACDPMFWRRWIVFGSGSNLEENKEKIKEKFNIKVVSDKKEPKEILSLGGKDIDIKTPAFIQVPPIQDPKDPVVKKGLAQALQDARELQLLTGIRNTFLEEFLEDFKILKESEGKEIKIATDRIKRKIIDFMANFEDVFPGVTNPEKQRIIQALSGLLTIFRNSES